MTFGKDQDIIGNEYWKLRKSHGSNGKNKGYKMTEEHKRKISEANKGKKRSPMVCKKLSLLKKGKSINHLKQYQFKKGHRPASFIDGSSRSRKYQFTEWKKIAKKVYERDNWTCQVCNKHGGVLNAHHIVLWAISKDDSLSNLITLCVKCHAKIHKKERDNRGRWKKK